MPLSFLRKSTNSLPFEYELVRSARRRSICIEIAKARVVVRAPYFVANAEIEAFVRDKSTWVVQKLEQQEHQLLALPAYSFENGSRLPYLGAELTLNISKGGRADICRVQGQLWVTLSSRSRLAEDLQVKRLVCEWYQQQALTLLREKTDQAAARLGVRHSGVSVKATRSKWGHCTARGAIQYNWQILLAPETVVDYLVAHEVSHLLHHNHSAAFWSVVANLCPDYKSRRVWLKAHGAKLMF